MVLTRASDGSRFVTWPMHGHAAYAQDGEFQYLRVGGGREVELPLDEEEALEAFGGFSFDVSQLEPYLARIVMWLDHDGADAWHGDLIIDDDYGVEAGATVTELE
jgi:hypothetical protein